MEVSIIKYYLILQYLSFKPKLIKTYYNKFKTTQNLYNFILNTSKSHLLNFLKYYYPHYNKHTINSKIINKLSNNKIIYLSNKLHKQQTKFITKI